MIKTLFFALLFLLIATAPAQAATDALVPDLQKRYEQMNSFVATFAQELTHQESGSVEKRKGSLTFQKPLRVRWETAKPNAEVLVINEKEIWDYLPDEELAYRYAPEVVNDSRSIVQVITGQSRLDKDFNVVREKDEDGLALLRLYPKEPTTQLVEGALWVNPETKLIRKALLMDFYGNTNQIVFESLTPDAPIKANTFTFSPPKGTEVEDLQKQGALERGLLQ